MCSKVCLSGVRCQPTHSSKSTEPEMLGLFSENSRFCVFCAPASCELQRVLQSGLVLWKWASLEAVLFGKQAC